MWTKKIWEHHFYTVFIVGNESATTIAVKEENSTGRCDKCTIFSSFMAKLSLAINEVSMILKSAWLKIKDKCIFTNGSSK